MPTRIFTITADDKPVALAGNSTADVSVTVTNTSGRPIRAQARVVALGNTAPGWLKIGGEVERDLAVGEARQFVVTFTIPAGTPAGKYSARLNVVSVKNPDDDFAEGPVISCEVTAAPAPPPAPPKKAWLFWVLLALILGGGLVGYLALRHDPETKPVLFDVDPKNPVAGAPVLFSAKTDGVVVDQVSWLFAGGPDNFDVEAHATARPYSAPGGGASPALEFTHVFTKPGNYKVTLTLTKNGVKSTSQPRDVKVDLVVYPDTYDFATSQNVMVDHKWGPHAIRGADSVRGISAKYDKISYPHATKAQLEIRYFAGDSRPVNVLWNDKPVAAGTLLAKSNSQWTELVDQIEIDDVRKDNNTLLITTTGLLPHIREISLTPLGGRNK